MSQENPLWGAPRIHGELLKLGFAVAQSTVARYMARRCYDPPGQSWATFVRNHAPQIAAMDLFVVPTIGFNLLYAFIIVRLARRELVWVNVTAHPTAEWVARQITEAFPWNEAPRYLIRDRDAIYGIVVKRRLRSMGIRDKPISARAPWQNCFAERLIGSILRECVDHFIIFGEQHLRQILRSYARYYNEARTHRSLNKDAPVSRPIQPNGRVISHALVGGLHLCVPKTTSALNQRENRRTLAAMVALILLALRLLAALFKSKSRLEAENAVLRQQLTVLRRNVRGRVRLTSGDRLFFAQLYRWFPPILGIITIVRPETLVRWHRAGFRRYWIWKSRSRGGRPPIGTELRALIRRMSQENPLWGAPRIHGELLKLGFAVAQSTAP